GHVVDAVQRVGEVLARDHATNQVRVGVTTRVVDARIEDGDTLAGAAGGVRPGGGGVDAREAPLRGQLGVVGRVERVRDAVGFGIADAGIGAIGADRVG